MAWRIDCGGVVDLFIHSPKENIGTEASLYADHNPVAILVSPLTFQDSPVAKLFNPYLSNGGLDSPKFFLACFHIPYSCPHKNYWPMDTQISRIMENGCR